MSAPVISTSKTTPDGLLRTLISSRRLVRANRLGRRKEVLSCGQDSLDEFLPFGGIERGHISELVGDGGKHLLAAHAMARCSRHDWTAYLAPAGLLNPALLAALEGELAHTFFLVESDGDTLGWGAQQLVASGLFSLVVLYASRPGDAHPLLSPVSYRRLLGLSKKQRTALLLLFDEHPALTRFARPCALRLAVRRLHREPRQRDAVQVKVLKCAGASPGKMMVVEPHG